MHLAAISAAKLVPLWACSVLLSASMVHGQLLSPGELSRPHIELEGVTNCTSCHTIGGRGVDESKCLGCHESIRVRIDRGSGLHGALTDPCIACHKDHLGREFSIVRLDTSSFDHGGLTGYDLIGAHASATCSSCHRPEFIVDKEVLADMATNPATRTYLGLNADCTGCHAADTPHGSQFVDRVCSDCHTSTEWKHTETFDHEKSRFPLTGRHVEVDCARCHPDTGVDSDIPQVRYVDLAFTECGDCHRDPHDASFGSACSSCHSTVGWPVLTSERTFDHSRTGFRLAGAHRRAACMACHRQPARMDREIQIEFAGDIANKRYPPLLASSCLSCHVDYHDGLFERYDSRGSCDDCHSQMNWLPTTYGLTAHNNEARFKLEGAHLSVPCSSCHRSEDDSLSLTFERTSCDACHEKDNPHGRQFDQRMGEASCASCHDATTWNSDVDFDHTATEFELRGAHAFVKCTGCHVPQGDISTQHGVDYTGLQTSCASCHQSESPHIGQFPDRDCGSCHNPTSFAGAAAEFDHSATRFPLDGAHANIPCTQCHFAAIAPDGRHFTRYLLEKTQCVDCHTSE
jgi:hypothetical protein